jgi:phenylalanyl-tRNA synthetase alpha chain
MADTEQLVLDALASASEINDTYDFASAHGLDHQALIGVIKSLHGDGYVLDEPRTTSFWTLTEEGEETRIKGSPEYQVFNAVPASAEGLDMTALQAALGDVVKIGLGPCMKNKWLAKQGDKVVRCAAGEVVDETAQVLSLIHSNSSAVSEDKCKDLKRRKLVQQVTRKSLKITKGPEFRVRRVRKMADLTKEMLGNKAEVRARPLFLPFLLPLHLLCISHRLSPTRTPQQRTRWARARTGPT